MTRADPDDGPDVRRAGRTRSSSTRRALGEPRRRRRRHRGPAPRRPPLRLHADRAHDRDGVQRGLGVTIHVGEEARQGGEEIGEVVEVAAPRPDRLRHPRRRRPGLDGSSARADVTLEICPTSNLLTKALADEDEVRESSAGSPSTKAVHDRNRRPGDDAHPPSRRVRAAPPIGALDDDGLAPNERGHEASFVGRRARP